MPRSLFAVAFLFAVLPCRASSQESKPAEPTPPLGLSLSPVPEVLYTHLPHLSRGRGLVVEKVTPRSPAQQAGLQPHDILVSYAGKPIASEAEFRRLVRAQGARSVPLAVVRRGRPVTLHVSLNPADDAAGAMGVVKPGGPPAVTVEAEPREGGKLNVTFFYFSDQTGRQERVTCSGTLPEIEKQVRDLGEQRQMPVRVQNLVDVALERIRVLNRPEPASKEGPVPLDRP